MDYFETSPEKLEWTTDPKLFEKFTKYLSEYHIDTWTGTVDVVTKNVAHEFNKKLL